MNQVFNAFIFNRCAYKFVQESKRFAGHSKWQNIKHQKEENDAKRSALFLQLQRKMKNAVLEGGSAKPVTNEKLARVVEYCKKVNMPAKLLSSILERLAARKGISQIALVEIIGPLNCIMIIKLMSDNIKEAKINLNTVIRKINAKTTSGTIGSTFNHYGVVIADKKNELEKAMEDALNVGATDIEEVEEDDNKYYKFKCEPQVLVKVTTQLKNLNYNIISTKEEFVPFSTIKVNDEDLQIIEAAQEKLLKLDEVHEIYDNMDHTPLSQ